MNVYVVGRFDGVSEWHVRGVYSSEEKAVARCSMSADFVGPVELDTDMTDAHHVWPGAYYPKSPKSGPESGPGSGP